MSEDGARAAPVLAGVRVVEVAQNLAGPFCARILAGLGATVIKVEPPGGDAARAWGPPFVDDLGSIFVFANPGKRSITLDLSRERGRALLGALVERADVLVEAMRPGALAAMSLGWDEMRATNPRLVYASVLAYGEEGPLAHLPGYEPLMQAHAGLMSYTGEAAGPPVRVGTSVVDMGTGMWAAIGVLAALRRREGTGRGTRVSASLYDTALTWSGYHLLDQVASGSLAGRWGSELPMICPYGAFPTADGRIMIAVGSDALFRRFCPVLGLDAALADARFTTNPGRVEHRAELNAAVTRRTGTWSSRALLAALREAGVPCAPIQDMAQVAEDPQTTASALLEHDASAGDGPPTVALPLRWDGARASRATPPPAAGADTDAILAELGLTPGEVAALRDDGVV